MKAVLASTNRGKAKEIGEMLKDIGVEIVALDEYPALKLPPETGETFIENALLKARHVAQETGMTALADDSGLEVDYLSGRPGVRSARYAGEGATDEENYKKLLAELEGVPREKRGARFRCALALVSPGGREEVSEGVFEGFITEAPRGGNGFGYDPVFLVPEKGLTAAELSPEQKNSMSHRAKALMELKKKFKKIEIPRNKTL